MGITIHYRGKMENIAHFPSLKDELIDIAKIMDWQWHELDEDLFKPAGARLVVKDGQAEISGHLPLKGLSIKLHADCESFDLYFDKDGNLSAPLLFIMVNEGSIKEEEAFLSVKTQFAPAEVHIAVVNLLRFLKKRYIPNLEVHDEGGYWETSDKEKLIEKMKFLDEKMDLVAKALSEIQIENARDLSLEELAKIIEEKLKKKL